MTEGVSRSAAPASVPFPSPLVPSNERSKMQAEGAGADCSPLTRLAALDDLSPPAGRGYYRKRVGWVRPLRYRRGKLPLWKRRISPRAGVNNGVVDFSIVAILREHLSARIVYAGRVFRVHLIQKTQVQGRRLVT
jgi:hypothetical protein